MYVHNLTHTPCKQSSSYMFLRFPGQLINITDTVQVCPQMNPLNYTLVLLLHTLGNLNYSKCSWSVKSVKFTFCVISLQSLCCVTKHKKGDEQRVRAFPFLTRIGYLCLSMSLWIIDTVIWAWPQGRTSTNNYTISLIDATRLCWMGISKNIFTWKIYGLP